MLKLLHYSRWWPLLAGILICTVAAAVASLLFSTRPSSLIVPFAFLGVLVVVARRWGAVVGIAGSVVAGLIFAYRLYPPLHSLAVHSEAARSNLAWMVLAGVVLSYLFAPSHMTHPRK